MNPLLTILGLLLEAPAIFFVVACSEDKYEKYWNIGLVLGMIGFLLIVIGLSGDIE